jgi:hypothetical protein
MENNMIRKYLTTAITLLLLSAIGFAQNLPDAPNVAESTFPSAKTNTFAGSTPTVSRDYAAAAKKPWIDLNVADATYWDSTLALVGSTVVNVEITARCSKEHTCLTWIANTPSRGQLYAYTLPVDGALSYLAYKLKGKGKTGLWMLPQMTFTAANLFSAGRSYGRIQ